MCSEVTSDLDMSFRTWAKSGMLENVKGLEVWIIGFSTRFDVAQTRSKHLRIGWNLGKGPTAVGPCYCLQNPWTWQLSELALGRASWAQDRARSLPPVLKCTVLSRRSLFEKTEIPGVVELRLRWFSCPREARKKIYTLAKVGSVDHQGKMTCVASNLWTKHS